MALRSSSSSYQRAFRCQTLYNAPRRRLTTPSKHLAPEAAIATPASQIPPESPNFINIPRSLQPQAVYRPWVKGVLPRPRKLFRPSEPNKVSPEYLASATPEPLPQNLERRSDPKTKELVGYKTRQAERRRENLRESLIELRFRKERTDRTIAAKSAKAQAFNRAQREAPEREDERLTNPTVFQADQVHRHKILPDPDREQRLAAKREHVASHKAELEEERKGMLHRLYVNAGQFITTGAQLDQVIDRVFDDQMQFANDSFKGFNVWNLGQPETVAEMLGEKGKGRDTRKAVHNLGGNKALMEERMKIIGEELTGGKSLGEDHTVA